MRAWARLLRSQGGRRGRGSRVLWASRIMNIPRALQRSSYRAGEFTGISELTCAVLESAFLTFQNPSHPCARAKPKPAREAEGLDMQPRSWMSVAIQFKWRPEERVPGPVLARQQLRGPGTAPAESGGLHYHALGSAVSPGLLIILQALSSL